MNLPRWLRLSLILPLLGLNLFVLRQALLRLAPFPALFISAALIAFLLDIPRRWLQHRGVPRPLTMVLVLVSALACSAIARLMGLKVEPGS